MSSTSIGAKSRMQQILIPGVGGKPLGRGRFIFPASGLDECRSAWKRADCRRSSFSTDVSGSKQRLDVVLGEPGLPTLRRRSVAVPFRSPENRLGVITVSRSGLHWRAQPQAECQARAAARTRLDDHLLAPSNRQSRGRDQAASDRQRRWTPCQPEQSRHGYLDSGTLSFGRGQGRTREHDRGGGHEGWLRFVASSPSRTGGLVSEQWRGLRGSGRRRDVGADPAIVRREADVAFTADPDAIDPSDELCGDHPPGACQCPRCRRDTLRDANAPGVSPGPRRFDVRLANIRSPSWTPCQDGDAGGGAVTPNTPSSKEASQTVSPSHRFRLWQHGGEL